MSAASAAAGPGPRDRRLDGQRRVGRGDGGHRHLDQFAAAPAQRVGHRQGRFQPGQRVRDGVATEHRPFYVGTDGGADHATGHRGVVAERRPPLVIPGDAQPDSARSGCDVIRPEPAPRQRRGTRAFDHDVGHREQLPHLVGLVVEIDAVGQLLAVDPVVEGAVAGPGTVRAARAFDLDDGGSGACQQSAAQRARPHRGQVGHQQAGRLARGRARAHWACQWRCGHGLAQAGRRDVEQGRPLGDRGHRMRCGPMLQRRPRIDGDFVGLQQRGHGRDVVGARQRDRAPPVQGRQQPGGAAGRHAAAAGQSEQCRPPGQQAGRIDGDIQSPTDRGGHPLGAGQHVGAGEVGRPVGQSRQVGQPAAAPLRRGRAHAHHCARGSERNVALQP